MWKEQKEVLNHNTKVFGGEEQQQAIDKLKQVLMTAPILVFPDYSCPFIVHTDASQESLGAILYQDFDGLKQVIAYSSRSFTPSEKNYLEHKLEFLVLKWSVCHKLHEHLYGNKFQMYTDNKPLTYE